MKKDQIQAAKIILIGVLATGSLVSAQTFWSAPTQAFPSGDTSPGITVPIDVSGSTQSKGSNPNYGAFGVGPLTVTGASSFLGNVNILAFQAPPAPPSPTPAPAPSTGYLRNLSKIFSRLPELDFSLNTRKALATHLGPANAPTDVQADGSAGSPVLITWGYPGPGSPNFAVERKVGTGSFAPLTTISPFDLFYDDYAVNPCTTYTYRVKTLSPGTHFTDSAWSATATTQTPGCPPYVPPSSNFYVQGKVGIGVSPLVPLHVGGTGEVRASSLAYTTPAIPLEANRICADSGGKLSLCPHGTIVLGPTSSSPWTVPDGIYKISVEIWGGGGGAGDAYPAIVGTTGSTASQIKAGGGGGGGGGYAKASIVVNPGQQIPFTIGAGGVGGNYNLNNGHGGNGGSTSFGYFLSANGGTGGTRGYQSSSFPIATYTAGLGGAGGTAVSCGTCASSSSISGTSGGNASGTTQGNYGQPGLAGAGYGGIGAGTCLTGGSTCFYGDGGFGTPGTIKITY
jgi:hypothetical protein